MELHFYYSEEFGPLNGYGIRADQLVFGAKPITEDEFFAAVTKSHGEEVADRLRAGVKEHRAQHT